PLLDVGRIGVVVEERAVVAAVSGAELAVDGGVGHRDLAVGVGDRTRGVADRDAAIGSARAVAPGAGGGRGGHEAGHGQQDAGGGGGEAGAEGSAAVRGASAHLELLTVLAAGALEGAAGGVIGWIERRAGFAVAPRRRSDQFSRRISASLAATSSP